MLRRTPLPPLEEVNSNLREAIEKAGDLVNNAHITKGADPRLLEALTLCADILFILRPTFNDQGLQSRLDNIRINWDFLKNQGVPGDLLIEIYAAIDKIRTIARAVVGKNETPCNSLLQDIANTLAELGDDPWEYMKDAEPIQ